MILALVICSRQPETSVPALRVCAHHLAAPGLAHAVSASPTQRSRQLIQLAQEATRTLRECLIQADWKPREINSAHKGQGVILSSTPLFHASLGVGQTPHGCGHPMRMWQNWERTRAAAKTCGAQKSPQVKGGWAA